MTRDRGDAGTQTPGSGARTPPHSPAAPQQWRQRRRRRSRPDSGAGFPQLQQNSNMSSKAEIRERAAQRGRSRNGDFLSGEHQVWSVKPTCRTGVRHREGKSTVPTDHVYRGRKEGRGSSRPCWPHNCVSQCLKTSRSLLLSLSLSLPPSLSLSLHTHTHTHTHGQKPGLSRKSPAIVNVTRTVCTTSM